MFNTKTGFAVLIFLLSMSSLLNSCTKNTESNISIDTESSKPKAQLVSSKDPKIPLYAVDIKICEDENYTIPKDIFGYLELVEFINDDCIKTSVPIWGSPNKDRIPKFFNPDIYFYRTSFVSTYLATVRYGVLSSFYGCYSDSLMPNERESYHLFPKISINIEKEFADNKKLIKIPDNMVSVRRINSNNEVQKLLDQYHVNKEIDIYDDCKFVDSSELESN